MKKPQPCRCRIGDKLLECKLNDFECLTCGDQFDGHGPDMKMVCAAQSCDGEPPGKGVER